MTTIASTGAIHSANFLPWLGTFDKIFRVEKFVVFDVAQFPLGKNWGSRVKILLNGNEHWLTMPIKRSGSSGQKEYEVEMLDPKYNWDKILKTIRQAYLKAPHFKDVFEFLNTECIIGDNTSLSDFNLDFITKVTRKLGNNTVKFVKTSEEKTLKESTNLKTDLIIEVCHAFKIENYLSGEGCLDFLQPELFGLKHINIKFQKFEHPKHKQLNVNNFIQGLSIIDSLMNCGFSGVSDMLNKRF